MAHRTRSLSDGSLFAQSSCWSFLIERLDTINKTWFLVIIFYCMTNRKRSDMRIFLQDASITEKRPWTLDGPLKVTSTTFLFKKVFIECLSAYQGLKGFISCYLITLHEKTLDDCFLVVNQWACGPLCKTSIKSSWPLSSQQYSHSLYQSIWLLL